MADRFGDRTAARADAVPGRGPARAGAPARVLAAAALGAGLLLAGSGGAAAKYAALVVEADSGEVLFSRNVDTRNHPASLTKMMTLFMVFEALDSGRLKLDQQLPVSAAAAAQPPSRLGLARGSSISVHQAIPALIVKSANDVAVVVAEALGGDERGFATRMTARAHELGLSRTTFSNASGLPARGQLSTARDMAALALALMERFPHHYHHFATRSFRWGRRTYSNHNRLLGGYAGTDGLKTGYIRASGFNLVASVQRNQRRLVGVVFGGRTGSSRDRHMRTLLDNAWNRLDRRVLLAAVPRPRPPAPDAGRIVVAAAAVPETAVPAPAAEPAPERAPAPVAAAAAGGPEPRRRPPVPAAAEGPAWGIQIGAFRAFSPAHRAATQAAGAVPELLLGTRADISRMTRDGRPLYRARLVGLAEARARDSCRRLEQQAITCSVVTPDRARLASLPG